MPKKQTAKYGEILAAIGGIIGLVYGVLNMLNMGFAFIPGIGMFLGPIITGIIAIVISLVILATCGIVDIPALKMDKNWIIILILGIILLFSAGDLPGILVIIGAILMVL